MQLFQILNQSAAAVSKRLVDCRSCTVCCEKGGVVYLNENEFPSLQEKGVPIVRVDGVTFIKRLPDGSCPMLDRSRRECSIYESRPLCCRLFPLDAVQAKRHLTWAVSNICPEERRKFRYLPDSVKPAIGLGAVARMTSTLDEMLDDKTIAFVRAKDVACFKIQRLEEPSDTWIPLVKIQPSEMPYTPKVEELLPMLELGHKDKQKLKEKLKEKKKNKKKKKKRK